MVIGIGVDVVDIDRFRRSLERTPGLADRLFTDDERQEMAARRDPTPGFAARFAAKEAVLKAMSCGLGAADMNEIGVVKAESGAPLLTLTGRAAELANRHGVSHWHLSLTHSDLVAQAFVIAEGDPSAGTPAEGELAGNDLADERDRAGGEPAGREPAGGEPAGREPAGDDTADPPPSEA